MRAIFYNLLIMAAAAMTVLACSEPPPAVTEGNGNEYGAAKATAEKADTISWPTDGWAVSTPEAEGMDGEAIKAAADAIEAGDYGLVDQFLLIRHGRVIADYRFEHDYETLNAKYEQTDSQYSYDNANWHPFYQNTNLHTLQSSTKSVTSAVMGIAVDKGLINSIDLPAMSFFVAYSLDLTDPRKAAITVEDLLTMRSGIAWSKEGQSYDDPTHPTIILENSDNWIDYILEQPMATDPGAVWDYNDGVSVLLGKIVTEATGQRIDQFAREHLFEPIGINNFHWKISPDGEADTEGGLYLDTYDFARFAYLFLRKGMWGDQRVISEDWVNRSVKPVVEDILPDNDKVNRGYGYQWWVLDQENGEAKIYGAMGYGGQYAIVSPEHDLVAIFNGWNIHDRHNITLGILQERFIPAIKR